MSKKSLIPDCSDHGESKLYIGIRAYKSPPKENYRNLSESFWAAYRASKIKKNGENSSEEAAQEEETTTMTAYSTTTVAQPPSPANTMKQMDGKSKHKRVLMDTAICIGYNE